MPKSNTNGLINLKQKIIKTIIFTVVGAIFGLSHGLINSPKVHSAPSSYLNFQARLLSSSGAIVPDGNYHVEFKLYDQQTLGSALWTETRTTGNLVSVKNGYLSVHLGSVNAFPSSINWSEELWLTMNIGGSSGVADWDGEMNPRIRLTAVPFAFQSEQLAKTVGSNKGSLQFGSVTNDPSLVLPNESGTLCVQGSSNCGFLQGSGTAFLQGGNNFGGTTAGTIGTVNNGPLNFITNNSTKMTLQANGDLAVDTNTLFVDATNNRVGIGTAAPSTTLDVSGNVNVSSRLQVGAAEGINECPTIIGPAICDFGIKNINSSSEVLNASYGIFNSLIMTGSSNNAPDNYASLNSISVGGSTTFLGNQIGVNGTAAYSGSGTLGGLIGVMGQAGAANLSNGSVSMIAGLQGVVGGGASTIGSAYGLSILSATLSGGTITNNYGIQVQAQSVGASNYGIAIGTASTQTLWLQGDGGTANTGIGFGSTRDTNLYRSAAGVLRTNGDLHVGSSLMVAGSGAFGSLASLDPNSALNLREEFTAVNVMSAALNSMAIINPTANTAGGGVAVSGHISSESLNSSTIGVMAGVSGYAAHNGSGAVAGLFGLGAGVENSGAGSVATAAGVFVDIAQGSGVASIVDNYGVLISEQLDAQNNYGIAIGTASTQTLWLQGDGGTANTGIGFGSARDTNLYRNASGVLATDSKLVVGSSASINTGAAANTGLVIQGAASQTANLQEWQNSTGTTLAYVGANGSFVQNQYPAGLPTVEFNGSNYTFRGASVASNNSSLTISPNTGGVVNVNGSASLNVAANAGNGGSVRLATSTATLASSGVGHGSVALNTSNGTALHVYGTNNGRRISISNNNPQDLGARLGLTTDSASVLGLIVRGATSQTANLQEWQSNTGTILASVSAAGVGSFANLLQNGNQVCDATNNCNYAPSTGGNGYIQNQTVTPQTAGFNITGNGTIGGNLTVDTNTLTVDATNNRVGIGTAAPAETLDVVGNAKVLGSMSLGNNSSGPVANGTALAINHISNALDDPYQCAFGCYAMALVSRTTTTNPIAGLGVGTYAQAGTTAGSFTLAQANGIRVDSTALGAGTTINDNYGIFVANQTAGTNDYGLYIQGADTYALWIDSGITRLDGDVVINGGNFTSRPAADSPIGYRVQNANGATLLSVDSSQPNNIAANSGAEASGTFATNWTTVGSSSITRTTTAANVAGGDAAVSVAAGTTANNGVRNNLAASPATNTEHVISFSAKLGSGSAFTDLEVGYSYNGGTTFTSCNNYSTRTLSSAEWVKVSCTLTTPANAVTNPDLIIRQPTTAGSARTFYVDNLTMMASTPSSTAGTLRVGGPTSQGLTLLTLDSFAGRPWTGDQNPLYGSMYYDTTLGKIQCYEGDGWGACGGAPDNIVNLVPEYAGSVLNGTGVGTMTADLCSDALNINDSGANAVCGAGQSYNFYKWTSPQATEQTYSVYISYQLPATFNGFADENTIRLTGRTSSTTGNNGVTFALYQANGVQCGTTTTVNNTTDTWQTTTLNGDETACTFAPNDIITFRINMTATSNSSAYVSNFSFTTLGK